MTKTAVRMLIKAVREAVSGGRERPGRWVYSQQQEIYVMFFIVRGNEQTMQITNPTAVKTMVQVPCSVTVFIMTLKVKM